MRKIGIMIGSKSDLSQCYLGLKWLIPFIENGNIEVAGVYINSIHRNTDAVFENVRNLAEAGVEALIVGAGWANHLTGTVDAYLRYTLGNTTMIVFGVAFEDVTSEHHTVAAELSITEVPDTKVEYCGCGIEGFSDACVKAVIDELPKIQLPKPRPIQIMSVEQAIKEYEATARSI